jgi:hypothetical protein
MNWASLARVDQLFHCPLPLRACESMNETLDPQVNVEILRKGE